MLKRILYALGILTERRSVKRPDTCDRLTYLARTSHY